MPMSQAALIFSLFGHERLAEAVANACGAPRGRLELRSFPDTETYLRYLDDVAGRDVVLFANLARPDARIPALFFAAATARELGARRVTLVAPYLAYMRQDHRFRSGEAVTSRIFADWVSTHFDALVTVDPHLHRYARLAEIYRIPATAVASAPAIATWLRTAVERPVVIGPDSESEQWVAAVARAAEVPWCIARKTRNGDRDVAIDMPDLASWRAHTPVIIDDIISSGRTMLETVRAVRAAGLAAPVCVGVHAVFADDADRALVDAGAREVITCDTLEHATNRIRIAPLLAAALRG